MSSLPGAESPPNVKTGSSTVVTVLLTVVVVPLTIRLPPIVTLLGIAIVTVPALSVTSISLDVPAKVRVPPKATGEVLEPSETVIELLVNEPLAIADKVLLPPFIVLLVRV